MAPTISKNASRPRRVDLYCGPKSQIPVPDGDGTYVERQLPVIDEMERSGEWVFEEKYDGFWSCTSFEGGVITSIISRVGLPIDSDLVGMRIPGSSFTGKLAGELVADLVDGPNGPERTGT